MAKHLLFMIGLCALAHTTMGFGIEMTDLIPQEKKVHLEYLSNGVKVYLQESERSFQAGSFRVVLRNPSSNEVLYSFDGRMESKDQIEMFFEHCTDKIARVTGDFDSDRYKYSGSKLPSLRVGSPTELAIIAVGDFPKEEMLETIEKHFGCLSLTHDSQISDDFSSIQIDSNAAINKVAMTVSFPNLARTIQTYEDLKESWKLLILQEIYQQRLEMCSRLIDEVWVHPHPRFFYPVNGYSFASEEISENLLSFTFWQIEAIRNEGFSEEEFYAVKHRIITQLQYLSSAASNPDNAFLASYYSDQFLMGDSCLATEPFLNASIELIQEIEASDLFPHIDAFLCKSKQFIHMVYPETSFARGLSKDEIASMIQRIASLASFYRDSEFEEDPFLQDDIDDSLSFPDRSMVNAKTRKSAKETETSLLLANNMEPNAFRLAANAAVIPVVDTSGAIESFYQLPLNDKEKRIIRTIFTTMAEKNIIQLALEKRTMEKKGKRVNHVHPMRFIGYIFSNSELRSCMRKIAKSSFKWDAFVDGFSRRMKEEYGNNNLIRHVPGFCQEVGSDPQEVTRFLEKKDWEGLVKSLL